MTLLDDYLPDAPVSSAVRPGDRVVAGRLDPDHGLQRSVSAVRPRTARVCRSGVDGNVYRDFLSNYTSLILGHAHPAIVRGRRGTGPSRLRVRGAD